MTDGMFFRKTLLDPLLSRYSVIMIDEAHERSVYTDLMLGILKKTRRKRSFLRLIVSSSTLDATSFLEYFTSGNAPDDATIVSLKGRMFPVQVAYLQEPVPDYVRKAAEVVWNVHLQMKWKGDILVFMTGPEETDRCLEELSEMLPSIGCLILTSHTVSLPRNAMRIWPLVLHAGLCKNEQLAVFESAERGSRKVVISTNIAEASVTIDSIKFVIDFGFVKVHYHSTLYKPIVDRLIRSAPIYLTTALSSLFTVPVS
ncbi:uncharacterized protein LAESUDRAFT_804154 [Laetiporus sulphureus 93-53]|uniref:P-loop containing nucleoside triphosphate hydrolase protein n=1 Tax=Laetiporus sulphureus 93-53 TaxID=1314785 RepID=A0A165B3E7_9APHY|nr:uncharacterized protein LAESUDRAFT_804154 [Laetiporus sulphureus 93-53]KZT00149.1 hypothetical protein LAESUDRAFT_804154 [Laetiporus sulphureus 93-53]